jgi:putative transcriptional regulator
MPMNKPSTSAKPRARIGRPPKGVDAAKIESLLAEVDWAAMDAMTNDDIARQVALDSNAAPLPMDVKVIRERTGLSQAMFARLFAIPLGTLRNWEQFRRSPDGPAKSLLRMIDHDPVHAVCVLQPKRAA